MAAEVSGQHCGHFHQWHRISHKMIGWSSFYDVWKCRRCGKESIVIYRIGGLRDIWEGIMDAYVR